MSVWRAGQLRNGHGGDGILCLALPALHTGSSGAQGPWSEFKTKPQPAVPVAKGVRARRASTRPGGLSPGGRSADWGFYLCQPRGGARDLAKPSFENKTASKLELSAPYTGPTRSTAQPKASQDVRPDRLVLYKTNQRDRPEPTTFTVDGAQE